MKKGLAAFLLALCISVPAAALTLDPWPGWVTATELDKALESAKKKNCPVVFLHASQQGDSDVSLARVYMKLPALQGMVRILVYDSTRLPTAFQKVRSQVDAASDKLPLVYITSPDLKIIGYIQSGGHEKVGRRVADLAWKMSKWLKKSQTDIEAADKGLEIGRFGTALKTYRRVQDEEKDCVIAVTLTWNVILAKDEAKPLYFPELGGKIDALPAAAAGWVAKAREAYDRKDYAGAKKLLGPMVADKCELDAWQQAAELLTKVDEATKAK